jgi:hypothetical protein
MKKVNNILGRMEASLNGSLDGLQLDNKCDVIEKSWKFGLWIQRSTSFLLNGHA